MGDKLINTILLVEDDEGYALLLERMFERSGIKCQLVWFPDGIEFLEYIKKHTPDGHTMLLLDLNLPVLSGFEILEMLRKNHSKEALPVIVISTTIRDKDTAACLEMGANSFLKKPLSYTDLTTTANNIGVYFENN